MLPNEFAHLIVNFTSVPSLSLSSILWVGNTRNYYTDNYFKFIEEFGWVQISSSGNYNLILKSLAGETLSKDRFPGIW
jgi:hypothetical protein